VAAATQATAFTMRPAGTLVSTMMTHLYFADLVGSAVMISSGA
jgi:hypothetical protein